MRSRLAVVMLALVACGGGATRDVRGPLANQPAADTRPARPKLTLDDALAMMPADTELVLELDVARLRRSILWERIEPWLRQQGGATLDEVARMCDFDPLGALDTMLLGARGIGGSVEMTLFVRGFQERKTEGCLEAAAAGARERGEDKRLRVDGNRMVLLDGGRVTLVFEFVDARTMLLASANSHFDDDIRLDEALARRDRGGLEPSSPLHRLVGRVDTAATLWMAIAGDASLLRSMPFHVGGVRLELHAGGDAARAVVGALVVEIDDAANASTMAQMFRAAIDSLKGGPFDDVAQALVVTEDTGGVIVDVRLDLAQLDRIVAVFAPLVP